MDAKRLLSLRWAALILGLATMLMNGCGVASIPSGYKAVVVTPMGHRKVILEGDFSVNLWSQVDRYDLRAQERNEDLVAITAEGAPVKAGSSLVTYSIVADELDSFDEGLGSDYYRILVEPTLQSTTRRVLAGYRWDQLDSDRILKAQNEITSVAAERLRPYHVRLHSLMLRLLFLDLPKAYRTIEETSIWEQKVQQAREQVAISRQKIEALKQLAGGIAAQHTRIAPTLTPDVLQDEANRAWLSLITAPTSTVGILAKNEKYQLEVSP
jgi:regulator of protease activity HflC (stomatin/prohibitin superfamily)